MLESVVSVLNQYVDVSYFQIYSIDAFRVDVEDTIYLIQTKQGAFAVYETDYFVSFNDAVQTLHELVEENNYTFEALQYLKDFPNEQIAESESKRFKFLLARISSSKSIVRSSPLTYGNKG